MANWVGSYKMTLQEGAGPKVADLLRQVENIDMPGCIKYNMAINGDTIFGYEEWETKKHHEDSMQIPEVQALVAQALPFISGQPEMMFEGEAI